MHSRPPPRHSIQRLAFCTPEEVCTNYAIPQVYDKPNTAHDRVRPLLYRKKSACSSQLCTEMAVLYVECWGLTGLKYLVYKRNAWVSFWCLVISFRILTLAKTSVKQMEINSIEMNLVGKNGSEIRLFYFLS